MLESRATPCDRCRSRSPSRPPPSGSSAPAPPRRPPSDPGAGTARDGEHRRRRAFADVARPPARRPRDPLHRHGGDPADPARRREGRGADVLRGVHEGRRGREDAAHRVPLQRRAGIGHVWLHMGSFAPRRAQMADEGFQPAPPYDWSTTRTRSSTSPTWCSSTPIDTGYSRVMPGVDNSQFHGQDGDIRAFGEFIAEYLAPTTAGRRRSS